MDILAGQVYKDNYAEKYYLVLRPNSMVIEETYISKKVVIHDDDTHRVAVLNENFNCIAIKDFVIDTEELLCRLPYSQRVNNHLTAHFKDLTRGYFYDVEEELKKTIKMDRIPCPIARMIEEEIINKDVLDE